MTNLSPHREASRKSLRLEVEILGAGDIISLEEGEGLRSWLAELVSAVAPQADSLGVRIADDETMLTFNKRHRGLNKSTDVLSFVGGISPEGNHLGDILISAPQAARQALESGIALIQELQILLLHGTLHCLGYDHETDDGSMERLEHEYRDQWIKMDR